MKPKVYFQYGFWKSINSNLTREGIRSMLNISDALSESLVITDINEDMIKEDLFLKALIKKGNYIRCDKKYIDKKLNSLKLEEDTIEESEELCATYILDKTSSECAMLEDDWGIVTICPGTLQNRDYLFKGDGIDDFDKSHRYNQRYMTFKEKLNKPCNSLIIIDPYILNKKPVRNANTNTTMVPGISNNLESLLDALLPHKLKLRFHLTIISNLETPNDIKLVYEKLKKCVKKIRPELDVILGLFYTAKGYSCWVESFHSRHLISNSYIIDSEDGFDLFNEKGYLIKNNPTISIVFPRIYGNSRKDYTKYEKWIKSSKKHVEESKEQSFSGSKINRLFNLVK